MSDSVENSIAAPQLRAFSSSQSSGARFSSRTLQTIFNAVNVATTAMENILPIQIATLKKIKIVITIYSGR